eukprot:6185605-Pleurochrysis_carterae.AAC.3
MLARLSVLYRITRGTPFVDGVHDLCHASATSGSFPALVLGRVPSRGDAPGHGAKALAELPVPFKDMSWRVNLLRRQTCCKGRPWQQRLPARSQEAVLQPLHCSFASHS